MSSRFLVALIATGTSALKVGILVALKATVNRNVISYCLRDFSGSESYSDKVMKVAEPPECGGPTFVTVLRTLM